MKTIIFIALTGLSSAALAGLPGGVESHTLECASPIDAENHTIVGSSYSLTCHTQALAPQYSLRGCDLFVTVMYPGATPKKVKLISSRQTAHEANFESVDGSYSIRVEKGDHLSAVIDMAKFGTSKCTEKADSGSSKQGSSAPKAQPRNTTGQQ